MPNLQTNCRLKLDFETLDQHTCKWFIHGIENSKDNQLQSLELPVEYPSGNAKSFGNMFSSVY